MTTNQAKHDMIEHLLRKSEEVFGAARLLPDQSPATVMNRCYYACSYVATAVLLHDGFRFAKHKGLRAAVHKRLVQSGRLSKEMAREYDVLLKARESADYEIIESWTKSEAIEAIQSAEKVVASLRALLPPPYGTGIHREDN